MAHGRICGLSLDGKVWGLTTRTSLFFFKTVLAILRLWINFIITFKFPHTCIYTHNMLMVLYWFCRLIWEALTEGCFSTHSRGVSLHSFKLLISFINFYSFHCTVLTLSLLNVFLFYQFWCYEWNFLFIFLDYPILVYGDRIKLFSILTFYVLIL